MRAGLSLQPELWDIPPSFICQFHEDLIPVLLACAHIYLLFAVCFLCTSLCHLSVVKGICSDSKDLLRRDPLLFLLMQTCIVLHLAYPAGAADFSLNASTKPLNNFQIF